MFGICSEKHHFECLMMNNEVRIFECHECNKKNDFYHQIYAEKNDMEQLCFLDMTSYRWLRIMLDSYHMGERGMLPEIKRIVNL